MVIIVTRLLKLNLSKWIFNFKVIWKEKINYDRDYYCSFDYFGRCFSTLYWYDDWNVYEVRDANSPYELSENEEGEVFIEETINEF